MTTDSNSNGDTAQTNRITFDLGRVRTINVLSALPAITQAVTIDGTTEPGYSGTPLVELNGSGAGSGTDGLQVEADDTKVQGLIIAQFSQDGIYVSAGSACHSKGKPANHIHAAVRLPEVVLEPGPDETLASCDERSHAGSR